jgi:Cof subfamily protein (haloacid dehalogenase superfamily)
MNLSNVKLIVSDMDGTLLNSHEQVSELFFEQFEKLHELGIHFVAASGRQYNSIAHKLQPIKDKITIVGENGAIAKRKDERLLLKTIAPKRLLKILPILRGIEGIFIIFCGEESAFIETDDPTLIDMFREYYGTHQIVDNLEDIANSTAVLKIALYHPISSADFIYPKIHHFDQDFLLKISGLNWLDLSAYGSNKGAALEVIQEQMNISPEETLVFGDYMNDLEMMDRAYFSFAMKNAHPEVIKKARFVTESNDDFGVENVLTKVIKAASQS